MLSLLVSLVTATLEIPGFPSVELKKDRMVFLKATGRGTRNYVCEDSHFTFRSLDAKLTGRRDMKEIGTISYVSVRGDIAPAATWVITKGDVTGTVSGKQELIDRTSAETASGYFTTSPGGRGKLGEMECVVAVRCTGGGAPKTKCTDGDKAEIPYTCEYWFVKAKETK